MICLGLDFETSGLDPAVDRVIEVGAVLWNTDSGLPLEILSVFCDSVDELSPEIEEITGIKCSMLRQHGRDSAEVFSELNTMLLKAEAVIAHFGATFDKGFYEAECARLPLTAVERTWIDTALDLKYPPAMLTRKLTHLAAEHGFLNPFRHRAVFDVLTMLTVFQHYDAAAALEYARQPMVTVRAIVSYEDREKAKARGYRWNPEEKLWLKNCRLPDVEVERREADFTVVVLANGVAA
jgi:DNA polymerase III subunit epsilon